MSDSYSSNAFEPAGYPLFLSSEEGQPGGLTKRPILPGSYQVDPDHTLVAWTVNHMGFSLLEGMFGAAEGSITIDPDRVAKSEVRVAFNVRDLCVTTGAFAQHLKSADLFDADRFPTILFTSTEVRSIDAIRAEIIGNLTIRDINKPVTLDAHFIGAGENPMSGKLNFGFAATATIDRSDFGLGFIVPAVSNKVKLRINAAFTAA